MKCSVSTEQYSVSNYDTGARYNWRYRSYTLSGPDIYSHCQMFNVIWFPGQFHKWPKDQRETCGTKTLPKLPGNKVFWFAFGSSRLRKSYSCYFGCWKRAKISCIEYLMISNFEDFSLWFFLQQRQLFRILHLNKRWQFRWHST